jgi:hypothetical protein
MANTLILNQPQVWNGLGTLTYTVATTEALNVQVQVTFPEAVAINSNVVANSAGVGADLVTGQLAMGGGSGAGLGAGTGGGGSGFTGGDLGTGHGGVGQGFGAGNSYQQPPSASSNITANSPVSSGLSIVVNNNGSPIYTSTAPATYQSALQFRTSFLASAGDVITVVLSSAVSSDNQLNGVTSNISVGQGL